MGRVIRGEIHHIRHLDHEEHRGPVAQRYRMHQLMEVLHAPLRGCVGKAGVAVLLQRNALHLHQMQPLGRLQAEVQPGLAEAVFAVDGGGIEPQRPFGKHLVGGLSVHIDELSIFLHGDQVIGRLAIGVRPLLQIHRRAGHQQLTAPARVLHMAHRLHAVQRHMGNKPVGTAQKNALLHLSVTHQPHLLTYFIVYHGILYLESPSPLQLSEASIYPKII